MPQKFVLLEGFYVFSQGAVDSPCIFLAKERLNKQPLELFAVPLAMASTESEKQRLLEEIYLERERINELLSQDAMRYAPVPRVPLTDSYAVWDMMTRQAVVTEDFHDVTHVSSALEMLQLESNMLKQDLAVATEKEEKLVEEIQGMIHNIRKMQTILASAEATVAERDLSTIERNIIIRFRQERVRLGLVTKKILPDDSMCLELMSELINRASVTRDYMDLEDNEGMAERVQFLVKTRFFEINPENPLQIRLKRLV